MIKLTQDKEKGWWIKVWDKGMGVMDSQKVAVTAEEVLDLNNQIMKLLVVENRCPRCFEPMAKIDKYTWECKEHKDFLVSKG